MTNKKRLEEIEKNLNPLGYGMGGHLISVNDIYWLVGYAKEQSKRIQELKSRIADNEHFVAEILEQNKRYREVIEKAIEEVYEEYETLWIVGNLQKALEGEE